MCCRREGWQWNFYDILALLLAICRSRWPVINWPMSVLSPRSRSCLKRYLRTRRCRMSAYVDLRIRRMSAAIGSESLGNRFTRRFYTNNHKVKVTHILLHAITVYQLRSILAYESKCSKGLVFNNRSISWLYDLFSVKLSRASLPRDHCLRGSDN